MGKPIIEFEGVQIQCLLGQIKKYGSGTSKPLLFVFYNRTLENQF